MVMQKEWNQILKYCTDLGLSLLGTGYEMSKHWLRHKTRYKAGCDEHTENLFSHLSLLQPHLHNEQGKWKVAGAPQGCTEADE